MALEDLFPGRRTPEQERFLDTLFYHTGFWYATDVAGTEEAIVRDGFSRRKQTPRSSPLDRIAALFGKLSSQPVHEHYADPGFQVVSTRVLSPRYVTLLAANYTAPLETTIQVVSLSKVPSQLALLDGGNEESVIEFILSTPRQDQAPDGTYRFSSFGLVVPASEELVIRALVEQDLSLLNRVKREMFPAWEAQYPSVAVGAEAHARPETHPHRADTRLDALRGRLDRLQDRVAEATARLAQPLDFDAIYNAAYAAACATIAVPPTTEYRQPPTYRPQPTPRSVPEPRREPEHHVPPPDRYAGRVAVPIETPRPEPRTEPYVRPHPAPRPAPVAPVAPPRAPEPRVPPRAPYEPSPEDARRRADYLASLRRPAEEPQTPIQPYVPPQPSPERAQVVAEARAGARSVEDYLAGLQRTKSALTPAPTSPVATPEKVYRYTLEVDDINPNSGDFPGRTYTIIREGSRVRFEGDFFDAMEANLLGAVDLHMGIHEIPFAQYTEQGNQLHYQYRELVDTILRIKPRPTSDFLGDLCDSIYLGLEPNDARIYTHHHLLVANMPQTPTSRMGTEQLAILGRVVKIEELPPDYKGPTIDPHILGLRREPEAPTPPYVAPSTPVRSALESELDASGEELFTESELEELDALAEELFPEDRVPTLTPTPEAPQLTREITRSMVVPRHEGAPALATLDGALARDARNLGHGVTFDTAHPVPPDMADGHFGGAATGDAPAEYEMTTRGVLSTEAVQEEVGRRIAFPDVSQKKIEQSGEDLASLQRPAEESQKPAQTYTASRYELFAPTRYSSDIDWMLGIGATGPGVSAVFSVEDIVRAGPIPTPVREEVGRRTDISSRAEELFNERVRLFEQEHLSDAQLNDARKRLQEAYRANPMCLEWGRISAKKMFEKNRKQDLYNAIIILDELLEVDPTHAHAFADRAVLKVAGSYYSLGREVMLSQALTDIARACELEPRNSYFKYQQKDMQENALNYLAESAKLYEVEVRLSDFSPDYCRFFLMGHHLFRFTSLGDDPMRLVGSIGVKGLKEKTRNKNVAELTDLLPDKLKDSATPLPEYQQFVSQCVNLTASAKDYNLEPQKGQYLIVIEPQRYYDGNETGSVMLKNAGRVLSQQTAYDNPGRQRSEFIADIKKHLTYVYRTLDAIPFAELLS